MKCPYLGNQAVDRDSRKVMVEGEGHEKLKGAAKGGE